ncbi:TRAP transporter small permease [Rhizobium sp. FKL33]|uniref:TRAP transporter small permease n=1 Tax=Rhizobium sp. FKL33 TaxID=2562307 RepID=UPI0010C0EE29|nr:TRAP transporter small permease [Rhizobium sp. FKL33]
MTTMARLAQAGSIAGVLFGGFCLLIAMVLTGLSIAGALTIRPLPGEIELVEALCGFAVFAFMPYCQLRRGHVGVDLFVQPMGRGAMKWTQLVGDLVITALFGLVAWRHAIGMFDKIRNGETTPLLLLPIWWGFAIGLVFLVIATLVSLYTVFVDIEDIRKGRDGEASFGGHV